MNTRHIRHHHHGGKDSLLILATFTCQFQEKEKSRPDPVDREFWNFLFLGIWEEEVEQVWLKNFPIFGVDLHHRSYR